MNTARVDKTENEVFNPHPPEVDPVFLIREEPYSEIFLSDLSKLFKRGKFFVVSKISYSLEVLRSTAQFCYNDERLSLYKLVSNKKIVYFLDTFKGFFFLKPKLKINFSHAFIFISLLKTDLALPFGFKVIIVKKFKFAFGKPKT